MQIRMIRRMGAGSLAVSVLMLPAKGEAEATGSKGEAEVTESKGEAEVTESKQEMIRELLTIVGIVGMAEQMRDQHSVMELMQMQPSYHEMMEWATSEQPDLSEEDRQLLLARLDDFDAFAERFRALFNDGSTFRRSSRPSTRPSTTESSARQSSVRWSPSTAPRSDARASR